MWGEKREKKTLGGGGSLCYPLIQWLFIWRSPACIAGSTMVGKNPALGTLGDLELWVVDLTKAVDQVNNAPTVGQLVGFALFGGATEPWGNPYQFSPKVGQHSGASTGACSGSELFSKISSAISLA